MQKKLLIVAIFLGSFISFALEPMIGRALLPVFGGTPMVWVTCLGAFQLLMVGGYFYGKVRSAKCEVRSKGLGLHIGLLALVGAWCCALSFVSGNVIKAVSSLTGIGPVDVLVSVLALVGIAFILLSANSTIVQTLSGGDYRLYAISNLGSLLGLFTYPLLIEPFIGLTVQWSMLGGGILVYAAILCVASRSAVAPSTQHQVPSTTPAPSTKHQTPSNILYLLIPAISCALLNAVTTHLTLDIAPLPLLWAALLGVFLVSYIIGFSGRVGSGVWAIPAILSTVVALYMLSLWNGSSNIFTLVAASGAMLFFVCTFLHSWLYELRPDKSELPRYYLLNVVGGAVGGLLTSIVAPLVFSSVLEYPILIYISAAALLVWSAKRFSRVVTGLFLTSFVIVFTIIQANSYGRVDKDGKKRVTIDRRRGFFGTMSVMEIGASASDGKPIKIHEFYHGNTVHGIQVLRKEMERMPTCYYTPYSCGYAIWSHPNYKSGKPLRVNLIGLGVGVLFAYSRENDYYHAYEISSEALAVATDPKLFTFVSNSPAKKDLVLADARKGLEKELADGVEPYYVIIIDAFTGDNVPYHLSTKEALEVYFKLLKPDGVLCIHFSNKYLNLRPYIKRIGLEFGIEPIVVASKSDDARIGFASEVAFFTRRPEKLSPMPFESGRVSRTDLSQIEPMREMPTDDKGSFLPLVKFSE